MKLKNRVNIFGTHVSLIKRTEAAEQIRLLIGNKTGYVCFPDTYVIVLATKDEKLQYILNNSLLTFPDGQPLALYSKFKGFKNITSVSGYWLIKELLNTNVSHFFYGSTIDNLKKVKENINKEFPNSNVLGFKSPPWLELKEIEDNNLILKDLELINQLKPNIIWIGLNSPKQDYFMHYYANKFENSILIGVGGVFDYLSGKLKISPEWIKKLSLRWVYRIIQNPERYFKRNMYSIFHFIRLLFKETFNG